MKRKEVYRVLDGERDYQDERWGNKHITNGVPADSLKSVGDFMIYMEAYLEKAKQAYTTDSGNEGALENLRKIVGLGIACFEIHGLPKRK